jgi:hypothetical protein
LRITEQPLRHKATNLYNKLFNDKHNNPFNGILVGREEPDNFSWMVSGPGWMDGMGGVAVGPGQSRNHIIDFENIQNDLSNIINAFFAAH